MFIALQFIPLIRRCLHLLGIRLSPRALCALRYTLAGLLLSACADAPTLPRAFVHPADGELWVAITAPPGLPDLDTWMPYVRPVGSEAETGAVRHVSELRREAEQARQAGRLGVARKLNEQAARVAVISLRRMPEPAVVNSAMEAIDLWLRGVGTEVDLGRFAALQAAVEDVSTARTRAAHSLAVGDTAAAVLQISNAAETIRDQSPSAVALRALVRAEERLRQDPEPTREIDRALHLVRTSREALLSGDSNRALRRALYALQLAERQSRPDGGELPEPGR
jgi:hypothetical protein